MRVGGGGEAGRAERRKKKKNRINNSYAFNAIYSHQLKITFEVFTCIMCLKGRSKKHTKEECTGQVTP